LPYFYKINKAGVNLNKYKICAYAICKNEEQFVDRWMDSVSEADTIVVTDTGSIDKTVEKLRARGAIVYTEKIDPWRFDVARNIAMDHIQEDVDICVSNDLDEVFESGWRQKLEETWQKETTSAKYLFTCSYNSDGTPNKQHSMEKIHCRHGFCWVHPVHEHLEYSGAKPANAVWVDNLVLNHYPDLSKHRSQYLQLLELSAKENPNECQTILWLGREYMYYAVYDKCIETLKGYLELESAIWDEERSAAMRFIANSYRLKGNFDEARLWLYKAIAQCPRVREPYLQMARLRYDEKDWPIMFCMVEEALKITEKAGSYLLELEAWGYAFYDLGAISCYQLGLYKKSYEYAQKACEMEPNDTRLERNLELIKEKLI
jgi:glycosyltransferase involved in cell wall biosynthesis